MQKNLKKIIEVCEKVTHNRKKPNGQRKKKI